MKHPACVLVLALMALPAIAAPGAASALPAAGAAASPDSRAAFVRVSPTNPNDPLFPPDQWPRC